MHKEVEKQSGVFLTFVQHNKRELKSTKSKVIILHINKEDVQKVHFNCSMK